MKKKGGRGREKGKKDGRGGRGEEKGAKKELREGGRGGGRGVCVQCWCARGIPPLPNISGWVAKKRKKKKTDKKKRGGRNQGEKPILKKKKEGGYICSVLL